MFILILVNFPYLNIVSFLLQNCVIYFGVVVNILYVLIIVIVWYICIYTERNISPVTEFKASSLSFSYMNTIHHGLKYAIPTLLFSSNDKKNLEIFIFYPFFNFRFPHRGTHLVNFYIGIICILLAHAAEIMFIPYFWRQGQFSTITRINTMNVDHLSPIRYQGPLQLNSFKSDDFWID